jgi:uncharacterized protein
VVNPRRPFELNIGFLITAAIGTSREFPFDFDSIKLGEDLALHNFTGKVIFSRTQQGLLIQGKFSAGIPLECVRCLDEYSQSLGWEFTDLFAFNIKSVSESNLLVPEDGRIDLAPLLREYALLELPIQPICKSDCRGLCVVCGENLNHSDCGHNQDGNSSPFSELKDYFS